MKIVVYENKIQVNIRDDFQKAKEYFARHNLFVDFEFKQTNITGYKVIEQNFGSVGFRYQITGHENKIPLSKGHISIFCFNGNEFPINKIPTSKCQILANGILMTLMTYKEGDVIGETYTTIIHETMHAICYTLLGKGITLNDPMDILFKNGQWLYYYHNDQPDSSDSNFGEAWRLITPHLSLLNNSTTMYKYFKDSEIINLKPELVQLLDKARELAGVPFKITSGFRTPSQNAAVGGVPDSSHETGLAVDLAVANSVSGGKILLALAQVGFQRFGFYKDGHIHADIDTGKPSPCYWIK